MRSILPRNFEKVFEGCVHFLSMWNAGSYCPTCNNQPKYGHTLAHGVCVVIPAYPLSSTGVFLPDMTVMIHDILDEMSWNERHKNGEELLHSEGVRSLVVLDTSTKIRVRKLAIMVP